MIATMPSLYRYLVILLFGAAATAASASASTDPGRVAITFDDLPYVHPADEPPVSQLKSAIAAQSMIVGLLQKEQVPATGFVNEDKVQALGVTGVRLLEPWNTGLLELGNHGATHFDSNKLDMNAIERNIVNGETDIGPLTAKAGRHLRFFRFPYNHVGDTPERRLQIQQILSRHGYRLAATTIDNEDYLFNLAYECATTRNATADLARIRDAYLAYTATEIDYYRDLDRQVFGRDIPAVMLLHANRLNAAVLGKILDLFRERHDRFVSLFEAQADPAYATPPDYATAYGPMWGYRWAHARHVAVDGTKEKEAPNWIAHYCKAKE